MRDRSGGWYRQDRRGALDGAFPPRLIVLVLLLATGCARAQETGHGWPLGDSTYVFDRPDAEFELPGRLSEISGLAVFDDRHLAAVQDEKGTLYLLETATGRVVDEWDFGDDGDYEGVAVAEGQVYVLRSDGDVYVLGGRGRDAEAEKHETRLSASCDAEGLAYDAPRRRLLVACKEDGGAGRRNKAIYAFDLQTRAVDEAPAFVLDIEGFSRTMSDHPVNEQVRRFVEPVLDLSGFKPSALAIEPESGRIFVLSSVRKAIVALEPDGEVSAVWELPERLLQQPEGMAFLPGGDLFIASEAGGGRDAVLLRFNRRGGAE